MEPATDAGPSRSRRENLGALRDTFRGVTRANAGGQVLAGVTLLAIAIPEQLATSRLAGVPAYLAMIAFIAGTVAIVAFGSNPIMSVGADSTIAPLFAVVLVRLAPLSSTLYLELVAVCAVVTGLIIVGIGLIRLGWIADFLSLPIVTGFLGGIGVIIIVHQLPSALGVSAGGSSIFQRLSALTHVLGQVSGWSVALALGTLVVLSVGEKINGRLPWALAAILAATVLAATLNLAHHGVAQLGAVTAQLPTWRFGSLSAHEWSTVVTTSLTLVIVILSQSAATARTASDELGIATNMSRDFVGVGAANVLAGLLGAFPVDASPARTTVAALAGGRTKLVGLSAAALAIALSPLARFAHTIPLAALAGILFFIAARLIKIDQLRRIWRTSRFEFFLAIVAALGVIVIGVEPGIALAVALAILQQTWHTARPTMRELGRSPGTTSWEPLGPAGVTTQDHVLVVLFGDDLFFANAGVFRRELTALLAAKRDVRHLVFDAVAVSSIDFTGETTLAAVVGSLKKEGVNVVIARAQDDVARRLDESFDPTLASMARYDSVDAAVRAVAS